MRKTACGDDDLDGGFTALRFAVFFFMNTLGFFLRTFLVADSGGREDRGEERGSATYLSWSKDLNRAGRSFEGESGRPSGNRSLDLAFSGLSISSGTWSLVLVSDFPDTI
jgi:hypothetical protein